MNNLSIAIMCLVCLFSMERAESLVLMREGMLHLQPEF